MSTYPKDLTGMRFERLTVLKFLGVYGKNSRFLCQCDCGKVFDVNASRLVGGRSKSCGCSRRDNATKIYKHKTQERLYRIYHGFKQRCKNPKCPDYKGYGMRGISFSEEWNTYSAFKEWALGNGYADDLTLDRIDVNGDYSPDNCRWVNIKAQSNNKRNTLWYEIDGEKKTLVQWCNIYHVDYEKVRYRIRKKGLDLLTTLNDKTLAC